MRKSVRGPDGSAGSKGAKSNTKRVPKGKRTETIGRCARSKLQVLLDRHSNRETQPVVEPVDR